MASPFPVNPLIRPAENPTMRWGAPAIGPPGALRGPIPRVPVVPARPMPDFSPSPVPEEERISPRVPVPKADFPEHQHKDLHEKTMGEAFDDPHAHAFVRDLYSIVRKSRPHIAPRTLLETTRDAYHAVKHGFMTPQQAGAGLGRIAHLRHLQSLQQPAIQTGDENVEPNPPR